MALQTFGPISLGNIQAEFGGLNPINIRDYYRDDNFVPNNIDNINIPLYNPFQSPPPTIRFSNFYGGSDGDPPTTPRSKLR